MSPPPRPRPSPGQLIYNMGQSWLRHNDPTTPLARWGQLKPREQMFWEALGESIQRGFIGLLWDGFFCGATFGLFIAAIVFIVMVYR